MSFVTHKHNEQIKLEVRVLSHFVVNSQARVGFVKNTKPIQFYKTFDFSKMPMENVSECNKK